MSSWPTTPRTCKFARAGRRPPQIGLLARPASSAEQGRAPRPLLCARNAGLACALGSLLRHRRRRRHCQGRDRSIGPGTAQSQSRDSTRRRRNEPRRAAGRGPRDCFDERPAQRLVIALATRRSCGSVGAGSSMTIALTPTLPAGVLARSAVADRHAGAAGTSRQPDRALARSTAGAKRLPTRAPDRGRSPTRPSLPTLTPLPGSTRRTGPDWHEPPGSRAAGGTSGARLHPYILVAT